MGEENVAAVGKGEPPSYGDERDRTLTRRQALDVVRPHNDDGAAWGLSLSGGGIRSATFSLGVLQGLVKSKVPLPSGTTADTRLLRQFDYLSTVSGGGYVGGFFGSLFVAGRVSGDSPSRPAADPSSPQPADQNGADGRGWIGRLLGRLFKAGPVERDADATGKSAQSSSAQDEAAAARLMASNRTAAEAAYRILETEPPGRLHRDQKLDPDKPGTVMLAWLRENGRYMAPTGSGDLFYAFAMALRNWLATNFVLGTMIVFAFSALSLLRAALVNLDFQIGKFSFAKIEQDLLPGACDLIWWSPLGWGAVAIVIAWVGPVGLAFWQSHPGPGRTLGDEPRPLSRAARHIGMFGVALLLLPLLPLLPVPTFLQKIMWRVPLAGESWGNIAYAMRISGAMAVASVVWYYASSLIARSISEQRVVLTRWLSRGLIVMALVALVALVDTAAQTLYLGFAQEAAWATPASLLAALVWVVRRISLASSEKERSGALKMIPLGAIATGAALVLLVLVMILWDLAVIWLSWGGEPAVTDVLAGAYWERIRNLVLTLAIAIFLMVEASRYPGFLNLSSMQNLYAARLTRAYLGASNRARFAEKQQTRQRAARSVAEPHEKDHITVKDYYDNPLAPIHLVNVCVNQNNDPAEQLVQRDRKGKPLVLVPKGFSLDGKFYPMPIAKEGNEIDVELTIGDWIGVSGAAVSTGMGRASGLGFALLLTLANVRLGRWWRSDAFDDKVAGSKHRHPFLETQRYLLNEMLGSFHGTHRERQYLSDGGHFENTGIYPLLDPVRNVGLIVTADCGCDPRYEFGDLANLIRLARIDFGIEIEVDTDVLEDDTLQRVFGTVDDFAGDKVSDKCAILLNVFRDGRTRDDGPPHQRIVLLKPRRLTSTSADVVHYQKAHPLFPQEPTSDQFFDEAQWESYRRLGLEVARRVFGDGNDPAYESKLWARLLPGEARDGVPYARGIPGFARTTGLR